MATAPITTLPPYFPAASKPCREPAARFFFCFSTHGRQAMSNDGEAARRGLQRCQQELRAYMECMDK